MLALKERKKATAGVSLVALVVTIIVLIILTAAVIMTFMDGGIADRAREAVFKSDMQTYQEQLAMAKLNSSLDKSHLGKSVSFDASTLAEIKELLPDFKDEYDGVIEIVDGELIMGPAVLGANLTSKQANEKKWLAEIQIGEIQLTENSIANKVQVGDYVKYTPTSSSYSVSAADSGSSEQTIETERELNWRVLKTNGKQVTLISAEPTTAQLVLSARAGYLNGPDILDTVCNKLYSKNGVGKARNMKVEDVNELIGYDGQGMYDNKQQELQTLPEGVKTVSEFETKLGITLKYRETAEGEAKKFNDYVLNYYWYKGKNYLSTSDIKHKLVFGEAGNSKYYLSSTCTHITVYGSLLRYKIRIIESGAVSGQVLYNSEPREYIRTYSMRPVVTLSYLVQVEGEAGSHNSPETAWRITK